MRNLYIPLILLFASITAHANEPLIVAHRGASKNAPENTIPAFKLAWKQGADAIEGDFHQTKDGFIVCIHDKDTNKVSKANLVIKDSTLEDLRSLDVGRHHSRRFKGTVIPTLTEVLATVPEGKKIYIEIKSDESIVPALIEEIKESGLKTAQIVVISFDEKAIHSLKTIAPQYKAMWLSSFKENASGKITPSIETVLKTLKQIKADGFSSSKDRIDETFIKRVIDEGYEYHVWTVDKLKTAKRFSDWGAQSITTNAPGYMKKKLIIRNANKRP